MGEEFLFDGFTIGYALALTQFVMVWVLGAVYLRKADKVFDPLAAKAAKVALEAGQAGQGNGSGRFDRAANEEVPGR
jgi:hypothetical protein